LLPPASLLQLWIQVTSPSPILKHSKSP